MLTPINFAPIIPCPNAPPDEGLWIKPDREREPELYCFWKTMTGGDQVATSLCVNQPEPASDYSLKGHRGRRRKHRILQPLRTNEHSLNWSGAVVPADSGRRFTRIAARWRLPHVQPPVGSEKKGSLVSIWVGLGGWLSWMDSMPHMGSEHGWDKDGKPICRIWCQWWQGAGNEDGWLSRIVNGISANEGDELLFHLAVLGDGSVQFYFLNASTNQLGGVTASGDAPVSGSTAEWVVERPMRIAVASKTPGRGDDDDATHTAVPDTYVQAGLRTLPRFDRVVMRDCAARLGQSDNYRRRSIEYTNGIQLIEQDNVGSIIELQPSSRGNKLTVTKRRDDYAWP